MEKYRNKDFLLQECISGIEVEVPFFNIKGKYLVLDPGKIVSSSEIITSKLSDNNSYSFEWLEYQQICTKLKESTKKTRQVLRYNHLRTS
ncbi:TPA: hypothetical protein U0977_002057 [Streptococcus suis]|nr:hypothetical protein [Streptococcus suis]HEM3281785.1 hypothetical protein [Streptococcus suis]HEM3285889.1 hypothetical protein [Streptococcus suis]